MEKLKLCWRQPMGKLGMVIVFFWIFISLLAPLLATPADRDNPYMMNRVSYSTLPTPPNDESIFGTTSGGYDIFYGIVWGSRTALLVGLTTVLFSAIIGMLVGGVSAFIGGKVDELTMRFVDLFMSIPFLIAVIVMTTILGKGLIKIIVALIMFGWHRYARLMRGEVLCIKEKGYVVAAKSMGVSFWRIFFTHIVPNAVYPLIVLMSLNIGRMVLVAASLSFLGVGAESGFADWGQMINFSQNWIAGTPQDQFCYWYTYVIPSLAIFSFVLGWTLLGDALQDIQEDY